MASLKLLLGMIPSTLKIEQAEKALITEFEKLHTFSDSDLLANYKKLDGLVNSSDFIQKRKEIESLQYKNSEEQIKEKEFISLQKAKDIVLYFKTIGRHELKRFKDLDGSEKIIEFEKLEAFIKSPEFRILNKSLSPSSPYFPSKVSRFSMAGVSRGRYPYFLNTSFMISKI